MNKQDKLRTLGRKACEYIWSKPFGRDAQAKAYTELRRFIDRNFDTMGKDPEMLTHDDLGDFEVRDFSVDKAKREFTALVNDTEYEGNFELGHSQEEGVRLGDVTMNSCDALLLAQIETHLERHIDNEQSYYLQGVEDVSTYGTRKGSQFYGRGE